MTTNTEPAVAEAVDVSKQKRIRNGHKLHLKKVMANVDDITGDYEISLENELKTFKDCLERKLLVIRKLVEEILEEIDNDEKIAEEIENSENFQNMIKKKLIEVDQFFNKMKTEEIKSRERVVSKESVEKRTKVKLPKIEIEKFHGDPKKYRAFRDSFDIIAKNNKGLPDIEKFTYLRSYLAGDALRLQAGLALTTDNYEVALELIERRYGSKQVVISSYMDSLYKLPPIKTDNVKELREFHDNVEINLRSLEAIGMEPESYGCLLIPILKQSCHQSLICT